MLYPSVTLIINLKHIQGDKWRESDVLPQRNLKANIIFAKCLFTYILCCKSRDEAPGVMFIGLRKR